ncbi:MAG: rfaF [Gammaproteobacteria bacterium]|jgi:heptosyltransferase-2|nr:rfaF [Gammaproteobacteria bacterium]
MNKKILIVGPAWVGDMVMAQCLFKLLKQRDPEVIIDVLAPAWSLPLLERMPEISAAIVMPLGHGQLNLTERYRLGKRLRENKYDQAIVLPNSFKSALVLWWAKIPRRTGWRGEMRYFVLNDVRHLDKARYPLMIERFMALGLERDEPLPRDYPLPELQISSTSQTAALTRHQLAHPEQPILALCPGAEFGPAKQWPEEYYADIANAKLQEGWGVWIFGSPKDNVVAERIMQATQQRAINLAGKTKLEEAVDLLSLASVIVSNDSGLMHIGAALCKPLVAIYGPTSASFTPPLHKAAKILSLKLECQPCFQRTCPLQHHRCMRELRPAKVLAAMLE